MEQNQTNWLDEEAKQFKSSATYEELPSLKMQPNVIVEMEIDFSKPFQEWKGEQSNKTITKKIVPVVVNATKMCWWLNVKNPIYSDIIKLGREGQTKFKILQTGNQGSTRYVLVK